MTRRGLPLRGNVLRELRHERGWKQDRVAEALGVSLKSLGNWEAAGRPVGGRAEPDHIAALADFYDVPQETLIVEGYAPPKPVMTAAQRLEAVERQLGALAAAVNALRTGVAALPLPRQLPARRSGTGSKRSRRVGD